MATAIELTSNEVQGLCQKYFNSAGSHLASTGVQNCTWHVLSYKHKPISDSPSGFLGHHRFLVVDVQVKGENGTPVVHKIRFFTKSAPVEVASRMAYMEQFGVFEKEITVYRDVLPRLQDIFSGMAPKCYYADNNLLVFEDLQHSGFRMAAGRDGLLDYNHLQCTLKTLAALHAASIVFDVRGKYRLNQIFARAVEENAYPSISDKEHVRYKNFANGVKVFAELIKQMPKYQKQLDYILAKIKTKMSIIFELAQTSKTLCNVFSHGDLWANNVMFQYGKYGEIPIQSRLVDFQLARYAPPMMDVITILTIPTSREFRSKYLMELLQDYYRFMQEFLKRENLCLEDFLSKEEFWQTFEEYRIAGLIESCLFSHLTILPPSSTQSLTSSADGFSDFFDRKRVEICLDAFKNDQIYRERMTDMLEDFVDNYILSKGNKSD